MGVEEDIGLVIENGLDVAASEVWRTRVVGLTKLAAVNCKLRFGYDLYTREDRMRWPRKVADMNLMNQGERYQ